MEQHSLEQRQAPAGSRLLAEKDWLAAQKFKELIAAPKGHVPLSVVRETFTRRLNLSYDQRAYSWHEIQDSLSAVDDMVSNGDAR